MCGIFGIVTNYYNDFKGLLLESKKALNHRGPDSIGHSLIKIAENNMHLLLIHTRLRINGNGNSQPIKNKSGTIYLIINGEIFNWHRLEKELNFVCNQSDCEIIIPLYEKYKSTPQVIFEKLSGQYSFMLVDLETKTILVGRDHIGITPLYIGKYNGTTVFSSELKAITKTSYFFEDDPIISVFQPRSYYHEKFDDVLDSHLNCRMKHYLRLSQYSSKDCIYTVEEDINIVHEKIRELLTESVKSQLIDMLNNENGDYGVLLSGGLDSSLIASLVVKIGEQHGVESKRIKTFSVGINKDSPDLIAAREVSEFLGTDHHEYYFSIEEGINSLSDVIWYIESYDCTSVRASTAMYLLTKKIKENFSNLKVLYSGELADELLCYLYGANAPNDDAFQDETVHLVSNVHYFDCLRANKTCMANSLEVRVPFTDIHYVKYILSLHPKYKRFGKVNGFMEKKIVRDSFVGYIPQNILYRKKEQFSDGVSDFKKENNWIDNLKEYSENMYTDEEFEIIKKRYTYNTPESKEHLLYRIIFNKLFDCPSAEGTVKRWYPKWCDTKDPSGRLQTFYN